MDAMAELLELVELFDRPLFCSKLRGKPVDFLRERPAVVVGRFQVPPGIGQLAVARGIVRRLEKRIGCRHVRSHIAGQLDRLPIPVPGESHDRDGGRHQQDHCGPDHRPMPPRPFGRPVGQ